MVLEVVGAYGTRRVEHDAGPVTDPDLYGAVTAEAVARPEARPEFRSNG